ncbi:MAG: hypothetical protein IJJ33_01245 [Victivallales bacterium]|nr:hypothetical protein [Victivallales bacterium]
MDTKRHYYAYRSFWPELETRRRFRDEAGVTIHNVMISNTANSLGFPYTKYPPVWKWNGVYDLESFDRQLDDVLAVVPEARFLVMLDLNTPHWWTRYLGAFGVRYDSFYELGKISASTLWRRDTAEYMRIVMEHAQEKYGDRILAYVLGGGGATEWHDRSRGEESIYRLAAFRRWQREHGRPMTDIPGRIRRDSGSHDFCTEYRDDDSYYNGNDPTDGTYTEVFPNGFGLLRTPAEDGDVIDYLQFCAEFNADTVAFFLEKARAVLPSTVELGCFFGYCFAPWSMHAGHLAYERLLQRPELDFVIAPVINYNIGDGSISATVHATISAHGKRMLQEFDQKCWCYNRVMSDCCTLPPPATDEIGVHWEAGSDGAGLAETFTFGGGNGWSSPERVAEGIRRDSSMALINGDSLWWFDMWGGFYQHKEVLDAIRESHEIYEREIGGESDSVADALVVFDPENMLLVNDMNERTGTFHTKICHELAKSGAVFETCSFADLGKLDLSHFRLVCLCHPFNLPAEKMDVLRRKVLCDGRTVLFIYGTVIGENGEWDVGRNDLACGIPYAAPGLPTRKHDGWTAAYAFRPEEVLTSQRVRDLVACAGCHLWCDKARPVFANSRLVCLHTDRAEQLTLRLPRKAALVRELYSGEAWREVEEVTLRTTGVKTFLFKIEDVEPILSDRQ